MALYDNVSLVGVHMEAQPRPVSQKHQSMLTNCM